MINYRGNKEIVRLCDELGLSKKIRKESISINTELIVKRLTSARRMESLTAGIVYLVCKMNNEPRTMEEIAKYTLSSSGQIGRAYAYVKKKLELRTLPNTPKDFIPRFGRLLGISVETEELAIKIVENKKLLSGPYPQGLAATAIYLASLNNNDFRSQERISALTTVSIPTIRKNIEILTDKSEEENND